MSQTDANVQQVIELESQKVLYMECYGNPFFCDEDSCFNRKFCRFLFPVGWWNIYNQTDINNVSDSVVKLWRSRHLNTAQHSQLKPAVNVLQTTDTPKVEICTKCGVSHSQYMIFSCLSQAPRLPNGRPRIESVGRFPASFVATEAGYYLGEVGPCPASFVATILNFFSQGSRTISSRF